MFHSKRKLPTTHVSASSVQKFAWTKLMVSGLQNSDTSRLVDVKSRTARCNTVWSADCVKRPQKQNIHLPFCFPQVDIAIILLFPYWVIN